MENGVDFSRGFVRKSSARTGHSALTFNQVVVGSRPARSLPFPVHEVKSYLLTIVFLILLIYALYKGF